MNRLYNAIVQTITDNKQAFIDAGIKPPAFIDVYQGQPSDPDQAEFALPAVFVDYSVDYENNMAYAYLHVVTDYGSDTDSLSPSREAGLDYIKSLKILKRILQHIKPSPAFGVLRLHQETPTVSEFFLYHQITFRCALYLELDEELNTLTTTDFVLKQ